MCWFVKKCNPQKPMLIGWQSKKMCGAVFFSGTWHLLDHFTMGPCGSYTLFTHHWYFIAILFSIAMLQVDYQRVHIDHFPHLLPRLKIPQTVGLHKQPMADSLIHMDLYRYMLIIPKFMVTPCKKPPVWKFDHWFLVKYLHECRDSPKTPKALLLVYTKSIPVPINSYGIQKVYPIWMCIPGIFKWVIKFCNPLRSVGYTPLIHSLLTTQ